MICITELNSTLGKPTRKKSAVFFNIVQTGWGVIPMFKNYVVNFV